MKKHKIKCSNCKSEYKLTSGMLKEKDFNGILATYIECPVCGENILKQLDNEKTQLIAKKAVKLSFLSMKGLKMSSKQKTELRKLNSQLFIYRKKLNDLYWAQIYQELNS